MPTKISIVALPTHAASRGGTVCISKASLAVGTSGIVSFLWSGPALMRSYHSQYSAAAPIYAC